MREFSGGWIVTTTELDVLWEALDLPPRPLIIGRDSPGKTYAERERIVSNAWESLVRKGFASRRGEVLSNFARALCVIASPKQSIELRTQFDRLRCFVAATAHDGVAVSVRPTNDVAVTPIPVTGLARTAVAMLAPSTAGPGRSITVPAADCFDAAQAAKASESTVVFCEALERAGVHQDDARMLAAMANRTVETGQFVVTGYRDGRPTRAAYGLAFYRTASGSYTVNQSDNGAGVYLTVAPADSRRLVAMLTDYLARHTAG